jgi:hypothetical protein
MNQPPAAAFTSGVSARTNAGHSLRKPFLRETFGVELSSRKLPVTAQQVRHTPADLLRAILWGKGQLQAPETISSRWFNLATYTVVQPAIVSSAQSPDSPLTACSPSCVVRQRTSSILPGVKGKTLLHLQPHPPSFLKEGGKAGVAAKAGVVVAKAGLAAEAGILSILGTAEDLWRTNALCPISDSARTHSRRPACSRDDLEWSHQSPPGSGGHRSRRRNRYVDLRAGEDRVPGMPPDLVRP